MPIFGYHPKNPLDYCHFLFLLRLDALRDLLLFFFFLFALPAVAIVFFFYFWQAMVVAAHS